MYHCRFIEYNPTSLERNYKYEVLTEHDLGVTIDLINKDLYTPDFGQTLDPADEKLLEEDILTQTDSKRYVTKKNCLSLCYGSIKPYFSRDLILLDNEPVK